LGEGRLANAVLGALKAEKAARAALACLAIEGDLRAMAPLLQYLSASSKQVRRAACQAIASITTTLQPHLTKLLCRSCLPRFVRQPYAIAGQRSIQVIACRRCQHTTEVTFNVCEVVAVLDAALCQAYAHLGGVVYVRWLQRETLFDFDRMEIVRASEYEVERLCIQVSNDMDAFRQPRYRKMLCTVDTQCDLSQSALNMLKRTFGKVLVDVATRQYRNDSC